MSSSLIDITLLEWNSKLPSGRIIFRQDNMFEIYHKSKLISPNICHVNIYAAI